MKIKLKPGTLPYRMVIYFGVIFLKIWYMTLRVKRTDSMGVSTGKEAGNYAVAMWHNRIFCMLPLFHAKFRTNTVTVSSRSKDGQVMTDCVKHFGLETIRGSSNKEGRDKGGAAALILAIRALKSGKNICFTVDGPQGPKYKVKPGIFKASQKSGAKILPITANMHSYWEVKSWDKLQIPKPFSKVEVIIGEPITVEKSSTPEELDALKEKLEQSLLDLKVDKK
ncbi:MAG: lysophospholipid acyltransferase family protein [Lentisphaeraceae bacterium]|nr:lysophospholipid acyltransferase family protein [Lentisphaeraceae bacterium]